MTEYATTFKWRHNQYDDRSKGYYEHKGERDLTPDCPGEGWEMCGAAATEDALFWFWVHKPAPTHVKRPPPTPPRKLPDPEPTGGG